MRNFLKILSRYKTSTFLNIFGLATAFAAFYIILVQINYDFGFNRNINHSNDIYLVQLPDSFDKNSTEYNHWACRPIAEGILKDCPLIEAYGVGNIGEIPSEDYCFRKNDNIYDLELNSGGISMGLLKVFDFETIDGNIEQLETGKNIAISQKIAKKYNLEVGDNIYLGYKILPDKKQTIVAIYKDFPQNSDFNHTDFIYNIGEESINSWSEWSYTYYVKTIPGANLDEIHKQVWEKQNKFFASLSDSYNEDDLENSKLNLIPIKDTYFYGGNGVNGDVGNISTTYTLLGIAILVLLIALINFVNFFFALVPIRIKSVNTKKIFGSSVLKLRLSFVSEALGIISISLLIAFFLVYLIQSSTFVNYISAPINFSSNLIIVFITFIAAIIVALSGSIYPACYITSFPATFVLKGSFAASKSGQKLRLALIGVQFVISISLIISVIVIKLQHSYMMNYNMGFNKEMLLSTYLPNSIINGLEKRESFSNKLKENPQIIDLTYVDRDFIAGERMMWGRNFKETQISLSVTIVSWNFLKFMGIKVAEGRDFTKEDELKQNGTFIINEHGKKKYNITLEDKLNGHLDEPTEIAGFCKDFNFRPLQFNLDPFAFYVMGAKNPWRWPNHLYLRTTKNADIPAVIEYIKKTIVELAPDTRIDKIDVDLFNKELSELYKKEEKLATLISLFTVLSIIISLMGIFGLVMFEAQYRRKEIGLRRVHGASIKEILKMFNLKFVRIIILCFIIAVPISYYFLSKWLDTFPYRTAIHWWIFAASFFAVLILTVVIVTIRSWASATENPIDAIKTE